MDAAYTGKPWQAGRWVGSPATQNSRTVEVFLLLIPCSDFMMNHTHVTSQTIFELKFHCDPLFSFQMLSCWILAQKPLGQEKTATSHQ